MGKLKENKNDKISSLPRELSDEEFNQWIHGRFLEEAADIEKELDSIPDSEDWKPTEEKFQRLMSKAREQGFFTEADNSASLVKGMKVDDVITRLKGTDCNGRGTSCPDQLARALEEAIAQ